MDLSLVIQLLYGLPGPMQFIAICVAVGLVLSVGFFSIFLLIRAVRYWMRNSTSLLAYKKRVSNVHQHDYEKPDHLDAFGNVDLQDALLGKIIVADLRDHMRAWGSLCAGLLHMVYMAKQMHPELFHHVSNAQDKLACAGQKIANCYESNVTSFNDSISEISTIRNEFGEAVHAYQQGRELYISALQTAHARSDGAAKEALSNLRNFSK